MDFVPRGLQFLLVYLDNILVPSTSAEEHPVSPQGAVPLPTKVEVVVIFPRPHTVQPCRSTKGQEGQRRHGLVTKRVQTFEEAKAALANTAMLAHRSDATLVALTTDSSDFTVGTVCEQWVDMFGSP